MCEKESMILPLAKLGTLAIRTLSKPLATRVKTQATRHERFRTIIVNFAQAHHKFSVNLQRRIYGHATDVEVRPLDPDKAVQAASDLLGELVVFSVGVAAVLFEVQRSARSEARKEEARKQELEVLRQKDEELSRELVSLKEKQESFEKFLTGRGYPSWFSIRQAQSETKA